MAVDPEFEVSIGGVRFDPADEEPATRVADAEGGAPEPAQLEGWIVQFLRDLDPGEVGRLRQQYGLRLTDYVPQHAFVERLDGETAVHLQRDPLVRAVAAYRPELKLSPTIGVAPTIRTEESTDEGGQLLDAVLFDDADVAGVARLFADAGATHVLALDDRRIGGIARVRFRMTGTEGLTALAGLLDVRWIEPVAQIVDDNVNAATTIQSGTAGTGPIWDRGLHGEDQVIGVIDTGPLDINHCFFRDATNNTPGPSHRKVRALRNASGTAAGDHATFVAGCAAGDDVNAPGTAARRGGAWAARLVVGNRVDLAGTTLLAELNRAAASGAVIHTNSWHNRPGGPGVPAPYDQVARDVDAFTWSNENHLVLGSSGNNGEEQGPPGTAKNAICVSAAQADPNEHNLGDGNAGPTADRRRKPDLVAVGCGIQSATVGTPCGVGTRSPCATSYATPHAAAAAAIVRQYFLEGWYPTGEREPRRSLTPTGALLKAVLVNSTVDMSGVAGYPNNSEGWGLVQLSRALFFPGGPRRLRVEDVRHAAGLTLGQVREFTVKVATAGEPLKVVLVWTEPPATVGATPGAINAAPVVNDLDLEVDSPGRAQTFLGNFFAGGVSTPGGTPDTLNNVEVVLVQSPAAGSWTVRVRARRVARGNPGQGFAIAVSGDLGASACFVASAVYGDPGHPDVDLLRRWRDDRLAPGARGRVAMRVVIRAYEAVGPSLARPVRRWPRLAGALRRLVFAPAASALRRRSVAEWAG